MKIGMPNDWPLHRSRHTVRAVRVLDEQLGEREPLHFKSPIDGSKLKGVNGDFLVFHEDGERFEFMRPELFEGQYAPAEGGGVIVEVGGDE